MSPLTTGPLATSPLTLPSPPRGEGAAVPSPFQGVGRVRVG
jgi:hypothetical protein